MDIYTEVKQYLEKIKTEFNIDFNTEDFATNNELQRQFIYWKTTPINQRYPILVRNLNTNYISSYYKLEGDDKRLLIYKTNLGKIKLMNIIPDNLNF